MERVAPSSSPLSEVASYDSWEEVNVSCDKGWREVRYYLNRKDGGSDLAIIGKEKSLRHMRYRFAVRNAPLFASWMALGKLRSRREVIDWLNSVVSDSSPPKHSQEAGGFSSARYTSNLDLESFKDLQSRKLGKYTREFSWLGSPWTGRRRRNHYLSFRRNGVEISVNDFVYVLAEADKRLVAYLEDMYEDSRGNKMVVVRWFHKIDEVGIVLPHNFNDREIFFSLCLQDLCIECIDGLAAVLSPQHFKKFSNLAIHSQLEPFMCNKLFENDYVKPFDITKVKGYWKQDLVRYLSAASPLNSTLICQRNADDQKADVKTNDDVLIRPRKKRCLSKDDDICMHNLKRNGLVDAACADEQNLSNSMIDCKTGMDVCRQKRPGSPSLSPEEAKQNSSQYLKVGSQVEVFSQDSGLRGCWFRALIIKKHKNKVKVRYQDIQDAADEANKLEEWILASRVANPDQLGIRVCGRTTVRPSPLLNQGRVSLIVDVGTVVDAWWHDGWWEGIVVKKFAEDKLHVYFPGENQEAVVGHGDVRHSQDWVGNGWIFMKERPDLVNTILTRMGKSQDVEKSFVCDSVQTAICGSTQIKQDDPRCNDSNLDSRNDGATNSLQVLDLSKDLLSQLKWKSSRKRTRVGGFSVQKLNCSDNHSKSAKKAMESLATCEISLISTPLKVDHENCKYVGDSLFNSSVVPPLTSLVMSR
ncbi:hypothetical protein SLE2022_218920 [Rubroshorea leprosula]